MLMSAFGFLWLQYGQQVIFGHPRQVPYMSSYPPVRTPSPLLSFSHDSIKKKKSPFPLVYAEKILMVHEFVHAFYM